MIIRMYDEEFISDILEKNLSTRKVKTVLSKQSYILPNIMKENGIITHNRHEILEEDDLYLY